MAHLFEHRGLHHLRVQRDEVVAQHKAFKVAAAGCQDVLVGSEENVFHHDDHVTQVSFGSLLVQLHQKLSGVTKLLHLKDWETLKTRRKGQELITARTVIISTR